MEGKGTTRRVSVTGGSAGLFSRGLQRASGDCMPSRNNGRKKRKPRPLRALPIEQGTKATTLGSKVLHGRLSGPIHPSIAVCFKKESSGAPRGRGGETREEKEQSESSSWDQNGKVWTYLVSELREDNLSWEGRTLTVTNSYFWQQSGIQSWTEAALF
uniref:Chromosome 17 open reading frame 85 n=1 Tax=Nothobranchius pienaari TaxID=704102 RepID=A0A1A8PA87_9TELE